MLSAYLKKRKLRRYAKLLTVELKQTVGYRKYYTQAQVDAALKKTRLVKTDASPMVRDHYAYAMYCSPNEFDRIHAKGTCDACNYDRMRVDIAECVLDGQQDFTTATLTNYASPSSSSSSSSSSLGRSESFWGGSDSDGGGSDGGGGGGGGD
ncbi:hypothetical protein L4C36_05565 [Photobacterium japonica]|uniref:DUF6559 family protein n=1 Tax=Photobacterium japonica TaxID=2910235 RepID=UPI003D0ACE2D